MQRGHISGSCQRCRNNNLSGTRRTARTQFETRTLGSRRSPFAHGQIQKNKKREINNFITESLNFEARNEGEHWFVGELEKQVTEVSTFIAHLLSFSKMAWGVLYWYYSVPISVVSPKIPLETVKSNARPDWKPPSIVLVTPHCK